MIVTVGVSFWPASGSGHVPSHQKLLNTDIRVCQAELLPESILQLPRGRPSFQEYHHPEINPSHPAQDGCSNRSPWYSRTFIEFVTPPGHLTFQMLQQLYFNAIIEASRNHFCNQEQNPGRYKRTATCRSCSYWNSHDPHFQWRPSSIYKYIWRSTKGEDSPIEKPPTEL